MDNEQPLRLPTAVEGYAAYDLGSVERFLLEACEGRGRMMEAVASTRRRIADADAELAKSAETEARLARLVVDAQRMMREERRAHERALAAIRADGEARVEQIMIAAREHVVALRASLRGVDRPPAQPLVDSRPRAQEAG